ncbi:MULTISPECIES: hypothetical protein [Pacificibacter]|uniref:hypothetical protein n=1 Tax=Pacificibacter TaxID=1042323 RepID=UPI001C0991B2|nr:MULTISPECIES: hypothetical protein [Pacificibacter]MBU2934815.1 hypothetical protein [Pacificibacter marinus]MDO6615789.1 hypothetical protein [Pacificibacter sp. 1_MG-2023]
MEFIKEFLDEGRSRIKSNVFVSVVFAFVVLNWQSLYFVAFENTDALSKFKFFEDNANWQSLYLYPLVVGSLLAVGLPFVNNMAHWAVSWAINETRSRDDEYTHKRLKKKNEWEEVRLHERALYAEGLISEAQIEQKIDQTIDDPNVREQIKLKLDKENVDRRTKLNNLQTSYKNMRVRLDRVDDEIADKKAAIVNVKTQSMMTIGSSNSQHTVLEKEINRLVNEKAKLELDLETVKVELSKL